MPDSRRDRSSLKPAAPEIARVDEHNPIWKLPGYHVDNTQSWGPISASVVSRPAGEAVWRSDYHRIIYDPVGHTGEAQYENGPMRRYQRLADQISFLPRGVAARYNIPVPVQRILILQNPETYDSVISDMVQGGTVYLDEPSGAFDDPLVFQIASTIGNEMKRGFLDRILADALNTALAVQITQHFVDPSAIALEAGFADQSHFATLFRRETGVTPGQFRAALA